MADDYSFLPSIPSYDMAFAAAGKSMTAIGTTPNPIGLTNIAAAGENWSYYTGAVDSALASINSGLTFSEVKHQKVYQYLTRRVCLWCLGIDGCGVEASRVFKVVNTKWIAPYGNYQHYNDGTGGNNTYNSIDTALIPFKYRTVDADLSEAYREHYFGRTQFGSTAVGYFFKGFDEKPALIRRYADDSSDLANVSDVWADTRAAEAEVVVQLKMSVSATDCREYFQRQVSINDSKVNTISLCTAVPYFRNTDKLDYLDIRPFTKFNFPNEALIDTFEKAIIDPKTSFCIGLDYRIPAAHGLIDPTYVRNLKLSPSYNETTFAAEYLGVWLGGSDESWFDYSKLTKYRKIKNPEWIQKFREEKNVFYLISVDVGRLHD